MANINTRNGLSPAESHQLKVAVCFWVLIAGIALVVANALAVGI